MRLIFIGFDSHRSFTLLVGVEPIEHTEIVHLLKQAPAHRSDGWSLTATVVLRQI